jgi:lysophospholipase L1-like esterase
MLVVTFLTSFVRPVQEAPLIWSQPLMLAAMSSGVDGTSAVSRGGLESGSEADNSTGSGASKVHIALGDSISACAGASSSSACYTFLLARAEKASLRSYAASGAEACDVVQQAFNPEVTAPRNAVYTLMIGTNDASTKGPGAYEAVFRSCHQAVMAWLALPNSAKVPASHCRASGRWAPDSAYRPDFGMATNTKGAVLTCSLSTVGEPIYVWYRMIDGNRGAFSYSVDAGTERAVDGSSSPPIATQNGGREGIGFIRIAGVSAGRHTISFSVTSETGQNAVVSIFALGTPGTLRRGRLYSAGVLRFSGDEKATTTAAYDRDALDDARILAADGLPITVVDVRKFVDPVTDMSDSFHPNNAGHAHLRDAFLSAAQSLP